jgi:hypothetical protein
MGKIDFDGILRGCPRGSPTRSYWVLKELFRLDQNTVLTFLRGVSQDNTLSALKLMDEQKPLTPGQWRMLLRKMGATELEIVRTLREVS